MSRPYRDLTRAQIAAKQADNDNSRAQLNAFREELHRKSAEHDEKLWVEVKKMFGRVERKKSDPDLEHMKVSIQLNSQSLEVTNMLTAIAQDDQALQFELHIRDTPELVQQFGYGAD